MSPRIYCPKVLRGSFKENPRKPYSKSAEKKNMSYCDKIIQLFPARIHFVWVGGTVSGRPQFEFSNSVVGEK